MKVPIKYKAQNIKKWDCQTETSKGWIPVRPFNFGGIHILYRLKMTWFVFIGKMELPVL